MVHGGGELGDIEAVVLELELNVAALAEFLQLLHQVLRVFLLYDDH